MQGVVDHGTAHRMQSMYNIKSAIGGKTGTTNNQADAWFIGYTPQILAGVWVGCDDRSFRFGSMRLGQGSAAALPIWAYFMKRVYADKSLGIKYDAKFKEPDGFNNCEVENPPSTGGINTQGTSEPQEDEHAVPNDWENQ